MGKGSKSKEINEEIKNIASKYFFGFDINRRRYHWWHRSCDSERKNGRKESKC